MGKIRIPVGGKCRVSVKGGIPESVLNACAMKGIVIFELESVDGNTLGFSVDETDYQALEEISKEHLCILRRIGETESRKKLRFLKKHIFLPVFAALFLMGLALSSLYIWEIDVAGNEKLTDAEILRALSQCGVERGCFWPGIDNDTVRAEMMELLPGIAWMSVNVNGSRATVPVLERGELPEISGSLGYSDIVAANDGIIERVSAISGKPLVSAGQTVSKGEVLITGAVDSMDGSVEYMRSAGEVTARTMKEITLVCPEKESGKRSMGRSEKRFAVKFGKRRINFYRSGRNTVDECDKIIHNHIIGIDKIFALPVTIVEEEFIRYEILQKSFTDTEGMKKYLMTRVENDTDGEIKYSDIRFAEKGGLQYALMKCESIENIAKEETA